MTPNQNYKNLYPRGSEWRKWDLHIHSPLSALNNQYPKNSDGSPKWDNYIDKLENIKDVSVIGITDYFFIDGYKKVVEYKDQGRLKKFDLILPNVELRLDTFVVKDKSKDINFHVIFSDQLETDVIEKEFIGALDILGSGSVSGLNGARQLNKRSIQEIGQQIKRDHPVYKNDSVEEAAFKNITVSLKQVQELLRKGLFRGKFLFVLAGNEWADIDWNQAYLTKKNFLQTAHVLETGSLDTRNWALGRKDLSRDNFIKEFGALKPCIFGSDAHSLDKICKPNDDKFCWIKADPTFEGLKQVTHEPEERVYIGKSPPKGKTDAKVIDRVEIKNSNNWFDEKPIALNDNLVAIIGEKGAGKTALADFIALAAGDFDKEEDPGSFIFKALKSSKQIEDTIANCSINIYWRDKSSNSITITNDFKHYKDLEKVRYLSQSFIEKKCRPEQAGELQKEVESIIFQYIPPQDRMGQTTFIDLKNKKTRSIQLKKTTCKQEIVDLNAEIFDLEEEINSLGAKKQERSKLEAEIEQLQKEKPKPTTEEEKRIEGKLGLLNDWKNQLNVQVANYKIQLSTIETIKTKVEALKTYVDKQLVDIKNDLESINLANIYEKLQFAVPPDFNDVLNNKKSEIQTQIKGLQETEKLEEHISDHKTEDSPVVDLDVLTNEYISKLSLKKTNDLISILESKSSLAEDKRKTVKAFEEAIGNHQKRVAELTKSIKEIEETKKPLLPKKIEARDKTYKKYFILLQEEKKIFEELYAPLRERLDKESLGEKNEIEFFARIEVDVENFFNKADSIIDFSKTGRYFRNRALLSKEIKTISEQIELVETSDVYSLIAQLYKTFKEDKNKPIDIKKQLSGRKEKIDFYNWIFDVSDFSVTYSIKFQGTNIELLSPGKKGIVLLLMYLVLDTKSTVPLIIDQPEENLDNKSVYPYLINYFRTAKKRRQIIVISHNPNLVLNTDAEQIVVANFEAMPTNQDSRIRYISGAIENSFISEKAEIPIERQGIKEHGIDILEGGPEAFGKREDRYEIKR
jgi:ABC-type dipeptide/oligopeptide/nickel transport system ATPase subunit